MLLTNESLILNFECTLVFTNIHRMLQFLNLMETNQNFSDINFYHKIYITVWLCSFDHVMVNQTYLKTHSKKMIKILSTINRKLFCPHILIQLENNLYFLTLKIMSNFSETFRVRAPKLKHRNDLLTDVVYFDQLWGACSTRKLVETFIFLRHRFYV